MKMKELLDVVNNFKSGDVYEQIRNLKSLISYFDTNQINSIDSHVIDELLQNTKLSEMVSSIISLNDLTLYDNNVVYSIIERYASNNDISLEIEEEDFEELYKKNMDLSYDFDSTLYVKKYDRRRTASKNNLYKEIKHTKLTLEEERKLAIKIKNGDVKAREFMINNNIPLAIKYANKFSNNYEMIYDDLIQQGIEGIIYAIDRFDYTFGYRFSTYITWYIKRFIYNYIISHESIFSVSPDFMGKVFKMRKHFRLLSEELGREATQEELQNFLGVDDITFNLLNRVSSDMYSFEVLTDDLDRSVQKSFVMINETGESELIDDIIAKDLVKAILKKDMLPRDKILLLYRYGYFTGEEMTLEDVGKIFNITRQRAQQMESRAINTLKNSFKDMYYEEDAKLTLK